LHRLVVNRQAIGFFRLPSRRLALSDPHSKIVHGPARSGFIGGERLIKSFSSAVLNAFVR
jgi:hypothetical protein